MNLQYLKYFRTLAYHEHYTKASEELGIAQSSLSHAISSLEKQLGVFLFEKQGRNVVLTKQGKQYLAYVENALDILEDGNRRIQKSVSYSSGCIDIGFVSSVQKYLIELIKGFKEEYPEADCQFTLYEGITKPLLADLKNDRFDIILASDPEQDSEYETIPIVRQEIVVIVPSGHPLSTKERINPKELVNVPLILHTADSGMRHISEKILHAFQIHPFVSSEASDDRTIVSMVSLGLGAAIVTDSADIHKEGIVILPLDYANNYRYVYLISRKNHYKAPYTQNFIKFISNQTLY